MKASFVKEAFPIVLILNQNKIFNTKIISKITLLFDIFM